MSTALTGYGEKMIDLINEEEAKAAEEEEPNRFSMVTWMHSNRNESPTSGFESDIHLSTKSKWSPKDLI